MPPRSSAARRLTRPFCLQIMHIQEVIIDGFKSYATRTVVSNFDAGFNAITGLNASYW